MLKHRRTTKKKRTAARASSSAREFLLLNNQIYYVSSHTDREKLREFESSSHCRLPRSKEPSPNYPIPGPGTPKVSSKAAGRKPRPKRSLKEQIWSLSLT